ncbi:hypothetical protein TBLA_0H03800 [Henningerozyma blattae CBS 6284]|uniref:Translocation protein SEC62 n=1 Tax=Henningerozyma blattae (strain ATCC 34711 / CBS 6284 / DSM 70876 / NBRC 10599 / NRRL Y-10934 / UCD 77-7) TaxID=1071380 RepID=I2H8F9_HENB6|nr:hypothetical protein TBLA_0H03800 [Tetrapisispora blattae CBS 6284]CCH62661.1 hypothetical protein TBLA_0H03800 [Tetrapisispora blattae CBS 6284]
MSKSADSASATATASKAKQNTTVAVNSNNNEKKSIEIQINPETPMSVAKLLRHNKELKQRKGLFQQRQSDFFRYKRFIRALKSPEYTKKSKLQPDIFPPVILSETPATDPKEIEQEDIRARNIFITLIKTQLIVPAIKLHSNECFEHQLKPNKDYPHLILSNKAILQPDQYFVWNYNPKSWYDTFMGIGVIGLLLALVGYPLWPPFMRRGSYYLSMGSLALLGVFFAMALVRLFLHLISLPFCNKVTGGFWLFPNLFEDCGVLESFKPLYGFGEKILIPTLKR